MDITFQIINKLRDGDESAFRYLYDQYSSGIYNVAFRLLKNSHEAEEVVQETFIKLWEKANTLQADQNIWGFLYVVAKRKCFNRLRNMGKTWQTLEAYEVEVAGSATFFSEYENVELTRHIHHMVRTLPQKQRECLN